MDKSLQKRIKKLLKKHRKEHKVGNMFDHCYSIGFQGALMIVLEMLKED
jgi:hypothetical protein